MGAHGTFFPMHCEDMDLAAINYHHWGKPKVWIGISPKDATAMEKKVFEHLRGKNLIDEKCQNIFRHKCFILTPKFLIDNNIDYTLIYQNPGEFIITFPRGYHQGFNLGLNFAEATNFGNKDWVKLGREAKQCTCSWPEKNGASLITFPMEPFE
jgi:hypothetical protein